MEQNQHKKERVEAEYLLMNKKDRQRSMYAIAKSYGVSKIPGHIKRGKLLSRIDKISIDIINIHYFPKLLELTELLLLLK